LGHESRVPIRFESLRERRDLNHSCRPMDRSWNIAVSCQKVTRDNSMSTEPCGPSNRRPTRRRPHRLNMAVDTGNRCFSPNGNFRSCAKRYFFTIPAVWWVSGHMRAPNANGAATIWPDRRAETRLRMRALWSFSRQLLMETDLTEPSPNPSGIVRQILGSQLCGSRLAS
jgi:hypothetical protein